MDVPESDYDVIVVGAGISGLYAAKCLKEEGLKFVVLESRGRVGGRTLTDEESIGHADMGGAYFGHHQKYVIKLAKELGLEFYSVPDSGKKTMNYKGKIGHYTGDIPSANNIFELLDLANVVKEFDRLSLEVPLSQPWLASSAAALDSISVTDFLEKFCWTSYAKTLINIGLSAVFSSPSGGVSLLYALHLCRSCGGLKALFDQKGGLQEMKLIGGSQSISLRLAEQLQPLVHLNVRVTEINQRDDRVLVTTENGSVYQTRAVIVATSPAVLREVKWSPRLSSNHQAFVDLQFESRADMKTMMYYSHPYWEDKGLTGALFSSDGIVKIAFPDTKPDGSFPAIMGFVLENEYLALTREERKNAIAKHYAKLFGIEDMAAPIGYVEKTWNDEDGRQFSGPCVFALPPKFLTSHKTFWGEQFGKVYFAGSESSVVFRGYMDGGVRMGALAVKKILEDFSQTPKRNYSGLLDPAPYMQLPFFERHLPQISHLLWGLLFLFSLLILVIIGNFLM